MARKTKFQRNTEGKVNEELEALKGLVGQAAPADGYNLDGALLSVVIRLLTRKGAAIQVGTSMDKTQLTLKVYDDGYPVTLRASGEEEAAELLRRIALAYCPKGAMWDELRAWIEGYSV